MSFLAAPEETLCILFPCNTAGGLGQLITEGAKRIPAKVIQHGLPKDFKLLASLCLRENVKGLVGFPQHIFAFARWCEYKGIEVPIKRVMVSADYVAKAVRAEVERIWNAQFYEHFGMTEMGLVGAVDCDFHTGLHIRENDLYIEIINPKTGEILSDGEWGELVFSTLTRTAMPFIRYRTGDIARLLPGKCACGSKLKRLDSVGGRYADLIDCEGRSFAMPELEEILFAQEGLIDFYARYDGSSEELTLRFKTVRDYDQKQRRFYTSKRFIARA
jgi:phenylacetate-coenzyme A ligase PaaK-like adenylate-forming protein